MSDTVKKFIAAASFVVYGVVASSWLAPVANAQTSVDVAKVTCDQWVLYKIANPDYITMWLSGYYNAKLNNTVVDLEGLKEDASKVRDYCRAHPQTTLMQAVQTVVGAPK
jgi:hypothetical protein